MDADTLCLSNFASDIQDLVNEDKIAWHSEQFFAAERNNDIIKSAVENMLSANRQTYANPGGIKDLIQSNKDKKVNFIPSTLLDPTGSNLYTAKNWNIVLEDRELTTFLSNQNCKIIKLYNSMLSLGDFSESCVDEFLDSGNILSRLFLKVNQSKSFWVEQSKLIEQEF